jgi:stearoyl-CoA desaturase (delta-9 desaturase)
MQPLPATPGSIQLTGRAARLNQLIAALAVGIPVLATVVAILLLGLGRIHFTRIDFLIFAFMHTATGIGVTVGMHRMFTHHSFEAHPKVQAVLGVLGIMALQGDVKGWVATHRRHHRYSDQRGDPHSPVPHHHGKLGALRALVFVHFSRLFLAEDTLASVYAPDLCKDALVNKVDRLAPLWIFLTLAIPTAAGWLLEGGAGGAFSGLLWGGLVRIFIGQNVGSCVNSICHMFGKVHFKTTDTSKNNLWVGVAALGEGWHNNHHAFPSSARQGLLWWQLDVSYGVIFVLECLGLAWDVKVPTREMIARRRLEEPALDSELLPEANAPLLLI